MGHCRMCRRHLAYTRIARLLTHNTFHYICYLTGEITYAFVHTVSYSNLLTLRGNNEVWLGACTVSVWLSCSRIRWYTLVLNTGENTSLWGWEGHRMNVLSFCEWQWVIAHDTHHLYSRHSQHRYQYAFRNRIPAAVTQRCMYCSANFIRASNLPFIFTP